MKRMKLCDSEVIETNRTFDFPDGKVTIFESEVHELYRMEEVSSTRLVISGAIDRTRTFIAKTREDFAELNSVLRELVVR